MVGVCYFGSVLEVGQFVFRFLRKEVVGEANRQLAIAMQFVHHAIVVGIVLKSASSINGTRDAKAIQFPEEEPRRIKLVFPGELGALGQRGIKDVGIRFGITSAIDAGGGFQNYPDDYGVVNELHRNGELSIRLAYNLFTQRPKKELAEFYTYTI